MTGLAQADWDDQAEARALAREAELEAYVPDDTDLDLELVPVLKVPRHRMGIDPDDWPVVA